MKRDNLVQPHATLKNIWWMFFEEGFFYTKPIKWPWPWNDISFISFVYAPADPCAIPKRMNDDVQTKS